jgi:hypothetical protein
LRSSHLKHRQWADQPFILQIQVTNYFIVLAARNKAQASRPAEHRPAQNKLKYEFISDEKQA